MYDYHVIIERAKIVKPPLIVKGEPLHRPVFATEQRDGAEQKQIGPRVEPYETTPDGVLGRKWDFGIGSLDKDLDPATCELPHPRGRRCWRRCGIRPKDQRKALGRDVRRRDGVSGLGYEHEIGRGPYLTS